MELAYFPYLEDNETIRMIIYILLKSILKTIIYKCQYILMLMANAAQSLCSKIIRLTSLKP